MRRNPLLVFLFRLFRLGVRATTLRRFAIVGVVFFLAFAVPQAALAHGAELARIDVEEHSVGKATVRVVASEVTPLHTSIEGCESASRETSEKGDTFTVDCHGPLEGHALRVEGLGRDQPEASVRVTLASGRELTHIVTRDAATWTVPSISSRWTVFADYVPVGFWHVVWGADHLLFLLLLVWLVQKWRPALVAQTAFTLSHTLTLGLTAAGLLHFPSVVAEACIALSLLLVANDLERPGNGNATSKWGVPVTAFVFGSVHGMGFASGLDEAGLPEVHQALAFLGFAVGLELAQTLVILASLAFVGFVARRGWSRPAALVTAYGTGSVAAFWLLVRSLEVFR